jgi:hypothetical protein
MKYRSFPRRFWGCDHRRPFGLSQNTGENKQGLFLWEIRPFCAPRGTRTLGLLVRNQMLLIPWIMGNSLWRSRATIAFNICVLPSARPCSSGGHHHP